MGRLIKYPFIGALLGAIAGLPVSYGTCVGRATGCIPYEQTGLFDNSFSFEIIGPIVLTCAIIGGVIGFIRAVVAISRGYNRSGRRRAARRVDYGIQQALYDEQDETSAAQWRAQGRCLYCGGKRSFLSGKCKSCGK